MLSTAVLLRSAVDKPSIIRCATARATVSMNSSAAVSHGKSPLRLRQHPEIMTSRYHQRYRTIVPSLRVRPQSTMTAAFLDDDVTTSNNSNDMKNSNSTPFLLADIGEGITEVELLQWFIKPGDTVSQFDRICEVQSDKAAVEITSRFDGVVERLCGNVGDMMGVGRPLLYITTNSSTSSSSATANAGTGTTSAATASASPSNAKVGLEIVRDKQYTTVSTLHNVDDELDRLRIPPVGTKYPSYYNNDDEEVNCNQHRNESSSTGSTKVLTSPAVRRISKENHIDLGRIQGSGKGGRVLKGDVLKIIDPYHGGVDNSGGEMVIPVSNKSSSHVTSTTPNAKNSNVIPPIAMEDTTTASTIVPIRGYSRQMVKSMTLSLQVPHMVYSDEINVDALTDVRDSLRPLATEMGITKKLSHMPFFVKATSLALLKYPIMNSTIDVENMTMTYHNEHRVGVAVDTPRGLTVPVIGRCQEKSVLEIALELNRLYALVSRKY